MRIYLEKMKKLITEAEHTTYENGELDIIHQIAEKYISTIFVHRSDYLLRLSGILYTPFFLKDATEDDYKESFNKGKKELIKLLKVAVAEMQINEIEEKNVKNQEVHNNSNKIFIVHGHNDLMKNEVARTIDNLKLKPIILHEQPNKGRTIIEKFTEYTDVAYAIVLFSADDIAYPKSKSPDNAQYRARQNVIFELGFFIGKLGRERVIVLHEAGVDIEVLSDYHGVLYVIYDTLGAWKTKLVQELRESGIPVDANKIV